MPIRIEYCNYSISSEMIFATVNGVELEIPTQGNQCLVGKIGAVYGFVIKNHKLEDQLTDAIASIGFAKIKHLYRSKDRSEQQISKIINSLSALHIKKTSAVCKSA